jgi:hypothetical protein
VPDDRIAEWLLESVTTRTRAASTVGDLRETAASRGEIWFWRSVVATTAALTWRGMVADSRRLFALAFRAWLVSWGMTLLLFFGGAILFGFMLGALVVLDHGITGAFGGFSPLVGNSIAVAMIAFVQFWMGRWIARRAPGRELSACLAFALLQPIVECSVVIGVGVATGNIWPIITVDRLLLYVLGYFFCCIGALTLRRRARSEA